MDKEQWRVKLRTCLEKMDEKLRTEKSSQACRRLVSTQQFQDAAVVMMYLSTPYEMDTSEAILYAWRQDKTVAVPKVFWEDRYMMPVRIDSLESDFSTEVSGLRNPIKGVPVPFGDIDLVVTPALGYDRKGNRLGRGGAYYDRFFANAQLRAKRCGFGFSKQVVESLPVTGTDKKMDFLVTDEYILYFDNKERG